MPRAASGRPGPIRDGVGGFVILGGAAGGLFLLAIGTWASMMTIASAALAPGRVIAEGQRKAVQAADTAPVKALFVREGDYVRPGDPLVELDLSDVRAEVAVFATNRLQVLARRARLQAEMAGTELAFPDELLRAAEADPQVRAILDQERALFDARRIAYEGSVALVDQQIAGSRAQITGLEARLAATRRQLDSIVEERNSIAPLVAKGIVAKNRDLELQRLAAGLEADMEAIQTDIGTARSRADEGEIQRTQLAKARREDVSKALAEAESDLATIVPRLAAARDRLARAVIVSPEEGYVYEMAVRSTGATVNPGQTLLEIVPSREPLVLSVQINPRDIERIRPGQTASISLLPYNRRYQSLISGTLKSVSSDIVTEERTGHSYYTAIIDVDAADLRRAGAELFPGMPGEATINAGERTISEYFLDPILRTYDHAMKEQ